MILFGGIVDITKEINELHQFEFGAKKWSCIDDDIPHKDGIDISPSPNRKVRREEQDTGPTKEVEKKQSIKKTNSPDKM